MSLTRDGVWKAGVWAPTVWADGVWFEPAGQIGGGGGGPLDMGEESPPLQPILYIQEPADRFEPQRVRHGRLREQLRVALEGPQAEEIRAAVEPVPVDAATPLHERVDVYALAEPIIARIEAEWAAERRRRRERDEDDEIIMMLWG